MSWIWVAIAWLVQTSIMPLALGAATAALASLAWPGCAAGLRSRVAWAAGAAWVAHVALVLGGVVRDGAVVDYAAVIAATVAALLWRCGRRARTAG